MANLFRVSKSVGLWSLVYIALASLALPALAQSGPSALNVSGGLFLPSGQPILQNNVNFKIEILDKAATCVLYRELHSGENLSQTKGGFSLLVGRGSSVQNLVDGGAGVMTSKVFENSGTPVSFSGCTAVTMNSGDERMIRIYYDLGAGYVAMSPDVPIVSSAYAMIADSLQGKHADEFLQVNGTASGALNQPNADYAFSLTNWPRLKALLDGTSGQYMTQAPSAPVDFNGQRLTNLASPGTTSDAATKGYADTFIAGKSVDVTGIGPAVGDGKTLVWDQAQNKWVAGVPSAIDSSKLPLAGGTMSGAISMAGYDLYATGNITMSPLKALTLGTYTDADEATLVAGLLPANKGASWYNSTGNVYKIWNGTAAVPQAYLDSVTGKLDAGWIPNTSVVAGTYGTSASKVPTFTVGADGRLTAAGEVTISGVAPGGAAGGDLTGTYPNPTITSNAVTTGKVSDGAINTAKLSATSSALGGRILMTDGVDPNQIAYASCGLSEVMKWTASGWVCATVASLSPVTSVAGKTGVVTLNTGDISGLGGAALLDYGTAASELVQLDGTGHILPQLLPSNTGTITGVTAGTALVGGGVIGVVTLNVDVGTTAGKVVQLNGSSQLPGVDGSLLTSINAVKLQTRDVSSTAPAAGQVLGYNASLSQWEPTNSSVGSVVSVGGGPGLVGGPITSSGSLYVDMGTTAGKVLQLNGSAQLPGVDGSLLTSINAVKLQTYAVSAVAPAAGQILKWNGSTNVWEAQADLDSGGTVTNIVTSTGLLGGPISATGTLAVDVGTGANQVVQLNGSALLPALDGSQLFNINASKLATRDVSSAAPSAGQVLGWNSSLNSWQPVSAATGSVVDVTSGTGLVAGSITSSGTINVDVGTGANQVVQLNGSAQLPGVDGSLLTSVNAVKLQSYAVSTAAPSAGQILKWNGSTNLWEAQADVDSGGTVTNIVTSTGLLGGPISGTGTLAVDVGTGANQVVQLNGSALMPALDGSQLFNINASKLATRDVSSAAPSAGQVLGWNSSLNSWQPVSAATGSVVDVTSGTGLVAGSITSAGTINVDVGTGANQVVQLNGSAQLPALDASLLNLVNAVKLQTRDVSSTAPVGGQVLAYNASTSKWEPTDGSVGSVVNVAGGPGLIGGPITNSGSLYVDMGTTAGQVVQLNGSAQLPGVDGSLLSSVNAVKLQSYAVSSAAPSAGQILKWNGSTNVWEAQADVDSGGTVTNIVTSTGLLGGPISGTGTLAVDVGTGANQVVQLDGSSLLPTVDGSQLFNINASKLATRDVSSAAPSAGQVLGWNSSLNSWQPVSAATGSVVDVTSGTGLVAGSITSAGTINVDVGTGANQVVQLNGSAQLPALDASLLNLVNAVKIQTRDVSSTAPVGGQVLAYNASTSKWEPTDGSVGSVVRVDGGPGLIGGPITNSGSLYVDMGTTAGQVVQLNGSAQLPGVDGSLLTDINASKLATRDVSSSAPTAGQVLGWNSTLNTWQPVSATAGSVVQVTSGTGLVAGSITSAGTINVDVGTGANQVVQLNGSSQVPAVDGSLLTSINAVKLQSYAVSATAPSAGQILKWNGSTNVWEAQADIGSGGTVANIVTSTGLLGGPISTTGTLAVDVGTGVNQIVQLNASAQLPALDGSLLTNINASKLATRAVSSTAPSAGQVLGWNSSLNTWLPVSAATGSVLQVTSGTGLVAGSITSNGTINVDVGTGANKISQLNGNGQLAQALGASLTPAYSFSGNTNTGLYSQGTNQLALSTYGTARLVIDASGKVGVGTLTPAYPLDVNGAINATAIKINGVDIGTGSGDFMKDGSVAMTGDFLSANGTVGAPGMAFASDTDTGVYRIGANSLGLATGGTARFAIDNSGNIGMGTNSPAGKLEIKGSVAGDLLSIINNTNSNGFSTLAFNNDFGAAGEIFTNGSGQALLGGPGSMNLVLEVNSPMTFSTNTTERMRITGPGNVGIGTTSPRGILELVGTGTGASALIVPRDTTSGRPAVVSSVNGMMRYNTNLAAFEFFQNGTWSTYTTGIGAGGSVNLIASGTGMLGGPITTGGTLSVDVGTGANQISQLNSNGQLAQSRGSVSAPAYSFSGNTNTGFYSPAANQVALSTYGTARMTIDASGNLGIGTSTPNSTSKLHVVPNASAYLGLVLDKLDGTSGGSMVLNDATNSWDIDTNSGNLRFNLMGGNLGSFISTPLSLNRNGNIGVGTTNPRAVLDIVATGTGSSALIVPRDTTAGRPALVSSLNGMMRYNTDLSAFEFFQNGVWATYNTGSAGSSPWTTTGSDISYSAGKVGIGTTTPTDNLAISVLSGSDASFSIADDDVAHGMTAVAPTNQFLRITESGSLTGGANVNGFGDNSNTIGLNLIGNLGSTTPTAGVPAVALTGFKANGTSRQALGSYETVFGVYNGGAASPNFVMLGNGNVGIGTLSPGTPLDVAGNIKSARTLLTGGTSAFPDYAFSHSAQGNGMGMFFAANDELGFSTTSLERLRISSGGNVGIGTSTPLGILELNGTGTSASTLIVPRDTTAGRPAVVSSVNGMMRYNTNLAAFEFFQNGVWATYNTGSAGAVTFPLLASPGTSTASAPSYSFTGNANTGFYSPATNQVALSTAGTARLTVNATGQVGIGTTGPAYLLDLRSASTASQLHLSGTGVDSGGYITSPTTTSLQISAGSAYNGTNWIAKSTLSSIFEMEDSEFRFYSNTGLTPGGSFSPTVSLNIDEYGNIENRIGVNGFGMYEAGPTQFQVSRNEETGLGRGGAGILNLVTYGTARMVINGSNVGIGTTTPKAALDIFATGTGASSLIVPRDTTAGRPALASSVNGMMRYNTNLAAFEFFQNGVWATYNTGSAGAVTFPLLASPAISTAAAPSYSFTGNSNTGLYSPAANQVALSTYGTSRLTIDSKGYVGIGTTAPSSKLDVSLVSSGVEPNGASVTHRSQAPSGGNLSPYGMAVDFSHEVGSGQTNSGWPVGVFVISYRNGTGSTNDSGSITGQMAGLEVHYGHDMVNPAATPFTDTIAGLKLYPYVRTGSVANLYDLKIENGVLTGSTITNHFGLYQENTGIKNYFGGSVGIGTTTPKAALDVYATGTGSSALIVPRDTTAGRPAVISSVNGMLRYNTSTSKFEGFQSGAWTNLVSASSGDFLKDGSVPMTGNLQLNSKWLSNDGGNEGVHVTNAGLVQAGTGGVIADGNFTNDPAFVVSRAQASAPPYIGFLHENLDTAMIGISASNYFTMASEDSMNGLQFRTNGVFDASQFLDDAPIAMTIDNNGKVGIGTTIPSEKLAVVGNITGTGKIISTFGDMESYIVSNSVAPEYRMTRERVSGSVQSGDVLGSIDFGAFNGTAYKYNVANVKATVDGSVTSSSLPTRLSFYTTPSGSNSDQERMRIDSSGKVGIGTTNPTRAFEVVANTTSTLSQFQNTNASGYSEVEFVDSAGAFQGSIGYGNSSSSAPWKNNFYVGTENSTPLMLQTNSQERVRITSGGNVGIGTSIPGQKLSVAGTVESTSGGFKFPDGTTQATAAVNDSTSVMISAPQVLADATWTFIPWDVEDFDDGNWHDNVTDPTRLTVTSSGRYRVSMQGCFGTSSSGGFGIEIFKNGASLGKPSTIGEASNTTLVSQCVFQTFLINLTTADYVEMRMIQKTGSSKNLNTAGTFFQLERVK